MTRYAFIDAQNTASTTEQMLGFFVDWNKLCKYLKERWECEKIFLYIGIQEGDNVTEEELSLLDCYNCTVRSKTTKIYKIPDKRVQFTCPGCGTETAKVIDMGHRKKANCDVELTIDVLDYAGYKTEDGDETELLIFTGDGDFADLIERAVKEGSIVKIVSHAKIYKTKAGTIKSRFSIKLRNLIARYRGTISLIDIERWKDHIKKDVAMETMSIET